MDILEDIAIQTEQLFMALVSRPPKSPVMRLESEQGWFPTKGRWLHGLKGGIEITNVYITWPNKPRIPWGHWKRAFIDGSQVWLERRDGMRFRVERAFSEQRDTVVAHLNHCIATARTPPYERLLSLINRTDLGRRIDAWGDAVDSELVKRARTQLAAATTVEDYDRLSAQLVGPTDGYVAAVRSAANDRAK